MNVRNRRAKIEHTPTTLIVTPSRPLTVEEIEYLKKTRKESVSTITQMRQYIATLDDTNEEADTAKRAISIAQETVEKVDKMLAAHGVKI